MFIQTIKSILHINQENICSVVSKLAASASSALFRLTQSCNSLQSVNIGFLSRSFCVSLVSLLCFTCCSFKPSFLPVPSSFHQFKRIAIDRQMRQKSPNCILNCRHCGVHFPWSHGCGSFCMRLSRLLWACSSPLCPFTPLPPSSCPLAGCATWQLL